MAGKEIKERIQSVQETRKITSAMYLIASTKMRKAREELSNTRPYFETLRGEIKRIFRTANGVESRYFYPTDVTTPREGTYGCLVITASWILASAASKSPRNSRSYFAIFRLLSLPRPARETVLFRGISAPCASEPGGSAPPVREHRCPGPSGRRRPPGRSSRGRTGPRRLPLPWM